MTVTINCKGKLLDLSSPVVMGILNITPDSFFDGGKFTEETIIRDRVNQMLIEGASIIDIGAVSSRPGSEPVSEEEELQRLIPVIEMLIEEFPEIILSADTFRPEVARKAIEAGISIINDISGTDPNPEMHSVIAEYKVPYILMHMQGNPKTMQKNPVYNDVVLDIFSLIEKRVHHLKGLGLTDIIVDPGFGFGKTTEHNFSLLKHLAYFKQLGCPVLAGLSRKSIITKTLEIKSADALNGTTALNTIALLNGANILRVHDVKEAVEIIKLINKYNSTH